MPPPNIKQLLIVAGLSGAGKSTFIEVLGENRLPKSIMSQIPKGAARWPHSSFKRVMAEGLGQTGDGLVLHYNLSHGFAMDLADYFAGPAMKFLDEFSARIKRMPLAIQPREGPCLRTAWRALRSAIYSLTGRKGTRVKRGQKRLLELYQSPGGPQLRMDRWDDFLTHLCRKHPETRLIRIEPDPDAQDTPNFRRALD